MSSDFLVSYETYYRTEHDGTARYRVGDVRNYQRVEITESAGSPNYPMDHRKQGDFTYSVAYNKIGGVIRDRINKLYKDRFREQFMGSKVDVGVLLKAEEALKLLGGWNIRRLIENVKAAP